MQYDDVVAAMFEPNDAEAVAAPTQNASPARRLRDSLEPIAMHSVWSRGTNEALAARGHDFMTSYVCSRAALLGSPSPGVVASSFAVFEPSMISGIYQAGRAISEPADLLAVRDGATIESLSAVLAGEDIAPVADVMRRGVSAAAGTGRPLFSGLMDLGWPDSDVGRLWRASELFREHRGDSHVAACVTAGLDAAEMNVLTELWVGMPVASYSASRGWDEAALAAAVQRLSDRGLVADNQLTADGQAFRNELEAQTDRLQQPILDAVGGDFAATVEQLNLWSQRCIDARAFPPNAFKRAAG